MNVDTHAHYAPQRMLDAHFSGKASFPNVELMHEEDTYKPGSAGGALTRPVNPRLRHPEPRRPAPYRVRRVFHRERRAYVW